MSRIGKKPVAVPSGVKVSVANRAITVEGKLGKLVYTHRPEIKVSVENDGKSVVCTRDTEERETRAYHGLTRALIDNNTEITDRSSRQGLVKNADGSVDLYFGPRAPQGFEQNWIPTLAGKAWFPYFRLYGPTEAHFDRSWILPNIEKAR